MRCTLLLAVFGLGCVCLLGSQEVLRGNDSDRPRDIGEQIEEDGRITILTTDRGHVNAVLKTAEGRLYLRCDRLRILASPIKGAKWLRLEGTGNVDVRGSGFQAEAQRVTYDEENDRLIFTGSEATPASLTRFPERRLVEIVRGMKIIYFRGTGRIHMSN